MLIGNDRRRGGGGGGLAGVHVGRQTDRHRVLVLPLRHQQRPPLSLACTAHRRGRGGKGVWGGRGAQQLRRQEKGEKGGKKRG